MNRKKRFDFDGSISLGPVWDQFRYSTFGSTCVCLYSIKKKNSGPKLFSTSLGTVPLEHLSERQAFQ
jgi:hypothetical protein